MVKPDGLILVNVRFGPVVKITSIEISIQKQLSKYRLFSYCSGAFGKQIKNNTFYLAIG